MKFLNAALVSLVLSTSFFVNSANAGLILSNYTHVNTQGQEHTKTFNVSGMENYKNLVFTVKARGDYGTLSNELIEFFIDDTSFGEFTYNTAGVTSVVGPTGNSALDYIIDFSFTISDSDWTSLYANDSLLKIDWKNSNAVDARDNYFVDYSLSGEPSQVPEPTTLAIFALGMIGLASRRFKK